MQEYRVVKEICWDWEICHNNWCTDVKENFEELQLEYYFNEMCPVGINMFSKFDDFKVRKNMAGHNRI